MIFRIDDFPYGSLCTGWGHICFDDYRERSLEWIKPFEEHEVDYIWGVTPLLFNDGDIDFLNEHVKHGKIVMHGFDHGFEMWANIPRLEIEKTWKDGGEFRDLNYETLFKKYHQCDSILCNINSYDETHFIPPFNAFTQTLIDFFVDHTGVKTLHGETQVYEKYLKNKNIDFRGLNVIMPTDGDDYSFAKSIFEKLPSWLISGEKKSPTLHWLFDAHRGELNYYEQIAKKIGKK